MTNVTAVAYADMPLFLFHLLEYLDVDYEIDVEELNERWAQTPSVDVWSQFILKETDDHGRADHRGAASGIYMARRRTRALRFRRRDTDWHGIVDESEAFYLRILGPATTATRAPISGSW